MTVEDEIEFIKLIQYNYNGITKNLRYLFATLFLEAHAMAPHTQCSCTQRIVTCDKIYKKL